MELDLKNASLRKLILHYIGNKNNLEPLHLSKEALDLDIEVLQAIQDSFLARFRNNHEYFSFQHPSSLQYHEVYNYCKQVFDDPARFEELSGFIAQQLYDASTHPKVKNGEFYLAYFEALPVDGRMHKAIGMFKTENKSLFLDVVHTKKKFELHMKEGVELNRIDKGCLVIRNREDDGYDVLLFDNQNRGEEAQYWKEKFLSLAPQKNEFHNTNHFLTLTRQFITGQLQDDIKLDKTGKAGLLNRSIDYFRSKETFDIDEFQKEVFESEEVIESFRNFGSRYTESTDFDIASSFSISTDAVKKQSKVYKSVLKLDRNFHIYIHGRTDLIEKGIDTDGRKYYKIYYQEEN
jgi:hypothetical protein